MPGVTVGGMIAQRMAVVVRNGVMSSGGCHSRITVDDADGCGLEIMFWQLLFKNLIRVYPRNPRLLIDSISSINFRRRGVRWLPIAVPAGRLLRCRSLFPNFFDAFSADQAVQSRPWRNQRRIDFFICQLWLAVRTELGDCGLEPFFGIVLKLIAPPLRLFAALDWVHSPTAQAWRNRA